MGPLVDYLVVGEYVWAYQWHVPSLVAIAASCALAAAVNMSQYFCIGRFSAISFQVRGAERSTPIAHGIPSVFPAAPRAIPDWTRHAAIVLERVACGFSSKREAF
jgi:hypothetical protein